MTKPRDRETLLTLFVCLAPPRSETFCGDANLGTLSLGLSPTPRPWMLQGLHLEVNSLSHSRIRGRLKISAGFINRLEWRATSPWE